MPDRATPFFIGWAGVPPGLRWFLTGVVLGIMILLGGVAYLTAATQDDPGTGAFLGRAEAIGVLQTRPYPILHVTQSESFAPGTAILLTGFGKRGVQARAEPLDGQLVQAAGARIARGDIAALQLRGGDQGLSILEGAADAATIPVTPLGSWRVTGEICDGKCYAGAMRPGRGLAHKACANLCLIGGIPPVLVATDQIDGTEFFLLADAEGGPVTDRILDNVATLIEVDGAVERHGGMAVIRIDPDTLRLAR